MSLQTVRGAETRSPETSEHSISFLIQCYQDVSLYFFFCKSIEWSWCPSCCCRGLLKREVFSFQLLSQRIKEEEKVGEREQERNIRGDDKGEHLLTAFP